MQLVQSHTKIPIPTPLGSEFGADSGTIWMTFVPGVPLESCWDGLEDPIKERVCRQTWDIVEQLRHIPKPEHLQQSFLSYSDGTCSKDVLIADLEDPPRSLANSHAVRERICERYYHFYGRKYTVAELYCMLPDSDQSVFTHADLAARNIMVDDEANHITGIIDWERAGWYPDYWEYANLWKPSKDEHFDWQKWMDRTSPQKWKKWDIRGIDAARRVLL